MKPVSVNTGYSPREAFVVFHEREQRHAIMVCHRRAGKTMAIANDLIKRAMLNPRKEPPPRYAWFYPTRVRAKDIVWERLKHYCEKIVGHRVIESELAVELPNGARITLYGADNARGVGLWLDGVVYDEADEIPQSTIADVTPALNDYKGFIVYAGMLKGRHNLWPRFLKEANNPDYFRLMLKASESGIIDPEELRLSHNEMGEAAYQMQMECNAEASIANAIYGAEMDEVRKNNRITVVAHDPSSPLYVFFDVGHALKGDNWAMWLIQMVERDILLLKYHARTGKVPAYYADIIREWEEEYNKKTDAIYLPHDGAQQDQLGKSTKDHLMTAGLHRIRIVNRSPNVWSGINTMRALFPRVYINEPGCTEGWVLGEKPMPSGVDCLDFYEKKVEVQSGLTLDVPNHNQFSHGADALRTFAEAYAQKMLEGTSLFAQAGRSASINVTRDQVSPYRPRLNVRVSR